MASYQPKVNTQPGKNCIIYNKLILLRIMNHTMVHSDVENMMKSFRYDSHPMGMLISTISATSTFHPE